LFRHSTHARLAVAEHRTRRTAKKVQFGLLRLLHVMPAVHVISRIWERHFANTGKTREEAFELPERLLGKAWAENDESAAESMLKQSEKR